MTKRKKNSQPTDLLIKQQPQTPPIPIRPKKLPTILPTLKCITDTGNIYLTLKHVHTSI